MKNSKKFTLLIILFSATLTVMAGAIIAPVLNLIREGLGVSQALVGFIITTHALFIAIFSPLMGAIIDKIGAKKPFILGLMLYGLAGSSGLFISSYYLLIVSRIFLGIAVSAILTSILVMILNLYEGQERNKVMGWRGSANNFGGVIWPLIGGFLGAFSWHLPFAVYSLGIIVGFFAIAIVPETHKKELQDINKRNSVFKIFKTNHLLFLIYGLFFWGMVLLYAIVVFLPQLLDKMGIVRPLYISIFIMIMALSAGITSLFYSKIKSKLSYKTIVLITTTFWTIGFITISQTNSSLIIALALMIFGIGQGMIFPTAMVWIGEIVPVSFRGRISSYLGTFGFIGQFSSPVILGPISLFGLDKVFLAAGAFCGLLFLLFLLNWVILRSKHNNL